MARVSIGMELIDGNKFLKQLEQLESIIRSTVIENAIQAGTVPVEAAMLANTPESDGSRRQQSTKTKRRWSGAKKTQNDDSISSKAKEKTGCVDWPDWFGRAVIQRRWRTRKSVFKGS